MLLFWVHNVASVCQSKKYIYIFSGFIGDVGRTKKKRYQTSAWLTCFHIIKEIKEKSKLFKTAQIAQRQNLAEAPPDSFRGFVFVLCLIIFAYVCICL